MNTLRKIDFDESKSGDYTEELNEINIKGAREHNLKNVDLRIPRDKFIVITGLSGSGKSSLAFDTLYAEGQRRYVECLSPYAKQFMGMMKKPDVDTIEGLSPAISIEQKSISHNPRSTVGTTTEIYDYIRLLFAKIGIQHCVDCDIPVIKKTLDQIIYEIKTKYSGSSVLILSPLVKGRKGHYRELFDSLVSQGFTRVRIDGKIRLLEKGMKVERYSIHDIELVVDRITASDSSEKRLYESVELALNRGEGTVMVQPFEVDNANQPAELYSIHNSCPGCGKSYQQHAPNAFSFNSPYGACSKCQGLGTIKQIDIKKAIPDWKISLLEGAVIPLGKSDRSWTWSQIKNLAEKLKIKLDKPINKLDEEHIDILLNGLETSEVSDDDRSFFTMEFNGILNILMHQYENPQSAAHKRVIEEYVIESECPECNGAKLKKSSLAVKIQGININELCRQDIPDIIGNCIEIENNLSERELIIANLIFKEIITRLSFLNEVGLSYLSLDRSVRTLSGGESQRIRLASQIGSQLVGIMYVLDEPSIGLHQHDNNKLINSLKKLRDIGNTVIVVEHDKAMIEESDFVIDIGPGAGIHGGEIILTASPQDLLKSPNMLIGYEKSITAKYLNGDKSIPIPTSRREGNGKFIEIKGASGNNLKNVNLKLPLGTFTCITGMSGSGKSSLINDTLYPILTNHFQKVSILKPLDYREVSGLENIDKVIEIDQAPIGRTPRSNPATYTGIFTLIRDFFALLPESKVRGYKTGRFSFNVQGGRCEECQGAGIKKIEMNFLPDVYVTCDVCDGKRYNNETLAVLFKNKSIADVLDMTVEEANEFFKDIPKLNKKISTLFDVGLGYIKLGQQAPTLSGGEAQRVKLATELSKISTGKTLYLLDEPTTGLHFEDVNLLMKLLDKLVHKGNTVVVIEHNLDVIKCADYIIDLGPEGGKYGGLIIAEGTPEKIVKSKKSLTGKYLKDELKPKIK
ncbi:MAG: excinuclease ABC subunit UvrA [Candidatus Kapabacteria bacterium]|nr:excinuclease ABC subunit UvrA [Ignavibacteriota bacterium]MCW5885072.1 excinuclease ABC subunit UvrA [Candidatus Kapabacteria bacterium]